MDTDKLIACLSEDADPVRRLPVAMGPDCIVVCDRYPLCRRHRHDDGSARRSALKFSDFRFLLEQVAALCTAIGAAVAAFQSIVPGYNRNSFCFRWYRYRSGWPVSGKGVLRLVARRRSTKLYLGFPLHSGNCVGRNPAGRGDGSHAAKRSTPLAAYFGRAWGP